MLIISYTQRQEGKNWTHRWIWVFYRTFFSTVRYISQYFGRLRGDFWPSRTNSKPSTIKILVSLQSKLRHFKVSCHVFGTVLDSCTAIQIRLPFLSIYQSQVNFHHLIKPCCLSADLFWSLFLHLLTWSTYLC